MPYMANVYRKRTLAALHKVSHLPDEATARSVIEEHLVNDELGDIIGASLDWFDLVSFYTLFNDCNYVGEGADITLGAIRDTATRLYGAIKREQD